MTTQPQIVDRELEASGFRIEFWTDGLPSRRDIYTHIPVWNDPAPGRERKMQNAVGDIVSRGQFDDDTLLRFADIGRFPWPPGEECLKHAFTPVFGQRRGRTQMGCKPCIEAVAKGEAPGKAVQSSLAPTLAPVQLMSVACPKCPEVFAGLTPAEVVASLSEHNIQKHPRRKGGRPRKRPLPEKETP